MGMDFDINVNLKTIGKSDVESAEKSLEKILSYNGKTVALNLKFNDGNGADFTKYFANIEKLAQSAGKNVGNSFQQGFKAVKFNGNSEEFLKQFIAQENKVREEAKTTAQKYNTSNSIALKAINARNKAQEDANKKQQKEQQKINEQNLAQIRTSEETKKRIQVQQKIAEMKTQAQQKNAHNSELVSKGKDNIVKWKQQYDSKVQDTNTLALVESYKQASEYQQQEIEYIKLRNQYIQEGKKQEDEFYKSQQKANSQNLTSIRQSEESQKRIQVQQQIAAMKANATNKNAHYDELVQQGKDNIAKWKQDYQKQVEEVAKIQENYSIGKYTTNSSTYESQLSKYIGKNSEALSQMRQDVSEYLDIQDKLTQHFNGTNSLGNSDIVKYGDRLDTLQKQIKNTFTQIKNDSVLNSDVAFDKQFGNIKEKFSTYQTDLKSIQSKISKDVLGTTGFEKVSTLINKAEQATQRFNEELAKGKSANLDNLTSDLKEVNSLTKKATNEYEKLSSKASAIDQQNFINKLNKYAEANPRAIKAGQAQWNEMFNSAQSASMTAGQLKDAELNLKQFDNEMQAAGKTGKNFFDEFKRGFIKIGEFAYTYGAIQGVFNNISSSINELKDINTIVTEISKAADVPVKQLKDLETNSFSVASKYGQKASDYLLGVQEMTRAGYSNTSGMAELSTLAQSAGDMTAELANQYLIASDMAYGYGGNVEKLNALLDSQNQINKMVC